MTHDNENEDRVRATNEANPDLMIYLNELTDLVLGSARTVKDEREHLVKQRKYVAYGAKVLLQKEIEATEPERGRRTVLRAENVRDAKSIERYEFYDDEDFIAISQGNANVESVVVGRVTPEERIESYLDVGRDRAEEFDGNEQV
jgi:hypothetical protein